MSIAIAARPRTPNAVPKTAAARPRVEWVCAGRRCMSGLSVPGALLTGALERASHLTSRVTVQRWIRFRAEPERVPPAPTDAALTPLSDGLVAYLKKHPDYAQVDFSSGLAFWEHGLRRAFLWIVDEQPLCIQWMFDAHDNAALRRLPVWANMYPPIPPGSAQVEKLWTFSTARQKGIATRFAAAMFAEARRRGFRELLTHIHEANAPARMWAQKTGWEAYGTITRYGVDLPGLRSPHISVSTHRHD
jgi:GNAT superfamily N-acetyltransferase